MLTLTLVLLAANLLLLLYLLQRLLSQRRHTLQLLAETQALAAQANALPASLPSVLGERKGPLLVLEILNPQQLAAQESWLGHAFGGLAPALVRKIVYKQTVPMVKQELTKHGVEAQVDLYRVD